MSIDEIDWADMEPVLQVGHDFYTEEAVIKLLQKLESLEKDYKVIEDQYNDLNTRTSFLLGALEHGRKKDVDAAIKDVEEIINERK